MHELSIATPLLRIVLEEAKARGQGLEVGRVVLVAGLLMDLEPVTLKSCFELLAQGTLAENAQLDIRIKPLTGHCRSCQQTVTVEKRLFACPLCESRDVDWEKGREMYIESITVRENSQCSEGI